MQQLLKNLSLREMKVWTKIANFDRSLDLNSFQVSIKAHSNIDDFRKAVFHDYSSSFPGLNSSDILKYHNETSFHENYLSITMMPKFTTTAKV